MSSNKNHHEQKFKSSESSSDEDRKPNTQAEGISDSIIEANRDTTTIAWLEETTQSQERGHASSLNLEDVTTDNFEDSSIHGLASVNLPGAENGVTSSYQYSDCVDRRTLFFANVHHNVEEVELRAFFSQCGTVSSVSMVREYSTGRKKGYGFIVYDEETAAREACIKLNNYYLRADRAIKVRMADTNRRLYLGNIPKCKTAKHLKNDLQNQLIGLAKVIVYNGLNGESNRGFCFLDFNNHWQAKIAIHHLRDRLRNIWNCPFAVDWADPLPEPGDDVMCKVKIVYISNIAHNVTEDYIWQESRVFGEVERVKKIKNYAFVHFKERCYAFEAMKKLDGKIWEGMAIKVVLSKPPISKKHTEDLLQRRYNRKIQTSLKLETSLSHAENLVENEISRRNSYMALHESTTTIAFPSHGTQYAGIDTNQVCSTSSNDPHCACLAVTHGHEVYTCAPMCSHIGHCVRSATNPIQPLHTTMETYPSGDLPNEVPHQLLEHPQTPREMLNTFRSMSATGRESYEYAGYYELPRVEETWSSKNISNEVPYSPFEHSHAYERKLPELHFKRENNLQTTREVLNDFRSMSASGREAYEYVEDHDLPRAEETWPNGKVSNEEPNPPFGHLYVCRRELPELQFTRENGLQTPRLILNDFRSMSASGREACGYAEPTAKETCLSAEVSNKAPIPPFEHLCVYRRESPELYSTRENNFQTVKRVFKRHQ